MSSGGMRLFIFQTKHKASQSISQKFREKQKLTHRARPPPPLTHTHSQTCTQAHRHPHLVDRERMGDSDLLIYESFHSVKPQNDVSTDGWRSRPGQSAGTDWDEWLRWRKRRRGEKEEEFSSGSCRVAAVGALVSFPELWTALLGDTSHSAGPGQLMSCLLTLSLPPFSHINFKRCTEGKATCKCPTCILTALKMRCH